MKRRGFLGTAIAAAFAPKTLFAGPIAAPVEAVLLDSSGDLGIGTGTRPNLFLRGDGEWVELPDVSSYSVSYNLQAVRQDEFGETFFPTVVIQP